MDNVLFNKLRLELKLSDGVLNVLHCLDVQTSNAYTCIANLQICPGLQYTGKYTVMSFKDGRREGVRGEGGGGGGERQRSF